MSARVAHFGATFYLFAAAKIFNETQLKKKNKDWSQNVGVLVKGFNAP